MNGIEALQRMCKFNCSAIEIGSCFRPCEEHQAIEKELSVLQILKEKKVDLDYLRETLDYLREMSIYEEEAYVDRYNHHLMFYPSRQLTLEEMTLIVEWLKPDRSE